MTSDLSPNARRELAALAQIRGAGQAEAILISHQRRDIGGCLCGWAELGKSHAGHQVAMLSEAGLLPSPDDDLDGLDNVAPSRRAYNVVTQRN